MKILPISDLHIEFQADGGQAICQELVSADVLLIAGDLGLFNRYLAIRKALSILCKKYPHVIYVLGNHEYYHSSVQDVLKAAQDLQKDFPNLHWLENDTITIEGQRFVGTTLWFPETPVAQRYKRNFSDFAYISGSDPWIFNANKMAKKFLTATMKPDDIVITHHMPCGNSISETYRKDPFNVFFLCPMEKEILKTKPKLWLHGHTHDCFDYKFGDTRVLCNPYGYRHRGEGSKFKKDLLIEI